MTFERNIVISNDTAELAMVRDSVREGIESSGFPLKLCNRVTIAVDEAITNVIEHAFPDVPAGKGKIDVVIRIDAKRFRIEMVDDGMLHFDPRKCDTVDIEQHVSSGRDSGLGVFLMRRIMDEVEYAFRKGGRNRLVMVKYAD
ncbi:MAG: ATP-binding protein [Planctomycetota bacterium]|jgi:serine/threonine-protein kinase RsbW|nr:ATP-binding protein [Planctomycetota bacterium]